MDLGKNPNSPMNQNSAGLPQEQQEFLLDMLSDSWFNLLAVYGEMEVSFGDSCSRKIIRDESAAITKGLVQIEMKIMYNGAPAGTFRGKTEMKRFDISDFEKYHEQASLLRKHCPNSRLIPYGLMVAGGTGCIWKNAVAEEILFRTDLNVDQLDCILNKYHDDNLGVMINDYILNGFELTVIKVPILSGIKNIDQFIILAGDEWKNNENLYNATVIKEIHHRVKNNLQTIASLLRLQMRRTHSKTVRKVFQESINKISSIAMIHEELSKGGIEKINIKLTIANIMEMILSTMVPQEKDIKGELEGSDIYADANQTSMLSLCITELLQNSVEHAFQFRKKGTIRVKVQESEGFVTVVVEDDGVGFTRKKDKNSLGLEIIEMITKESLKGKFKIEGHLYGCKSTIRFPLTMTGRNL